MVVPPSDAWKLVLAIVLGAAILLSAYARAPRRAAPGSDLRRLVIPNAVRWLRTALALGLSPAYLAIGERPG